MESKVHAPLPEQYVWTAKEKRSGKLVYKFPAITAETEPHFFRRSFTVATVPREATLYIAGPRSADVWLNGMLAEHVESDVTSPLGMHVFATNVAKYLQPGVNTIAIEAVRGRGVTGFANSALVRQQTFGQVLVAKLARCGRAGRGGAGAADQRFAVEECGGGAGGLVARDVRRCGVGGGAEHWGHREFDGAVSVERGCGAV